MPIRLRDAYVDGAVGAFRCCVDQGNPLHVIGGAVRHCMDRRMQVGCVVEILVVVSPPLGGLVGAFVGDDRASLQD